RGSAIRSDAGRSLRLPWKTGGRIRYARTLTPAGQWCSRGDAAASGSRALFFLHLLERQTRRDRDHVEYGMSGVRRQAQLVQLLPRSNTHLGRVEGGTLLGQFLLAPVGLLALLQGDARAMLSDDLAGRKPRGRAVVER